MHLRYFRKSSAQLELLGLEDVGSAAKVDTAIVRVTLKRDTVEVSGQTWPVTLVAEGGGTGNYRGTVSHQLVVYERDRLVAELEIDDTGASGLYRWLELPVLVVTDTGHGIE